MDAKVAVVTGGAQGIGAATVKSFVHSGYAVAVIDMNPEAGARFLAEMAQPEELLRFYALNVTDEAQVNATFARIAGDFGRIDILVNNAGITKDGLFLRMKSDQWKLVLDVNLTGSFLCAKAVVPVMMKARFGRIINISSVVGEMGSAGQANYCASKAGLIGFTKSLARELGSRNITVNAVAPGYVITDMTKQLDEKVTEGYLRMIPLQRGATPEEIAAAILFLAGDGASYITGHVLDVNGGMYM